MMKVPVTWLREYVEFDASSGELAERLTFSGIEVEAIETYGCDYKGIVVGEILGVERHPGADNLRVCLVADGKEERRVVCGAENLGLGGKAPFALAGTTLPNGTEIVETKIRGETSEGMLCAEDELGISDDHSGIMLIPGEIAVGTPFSDVMGPPETVLVLEVTWNRPDCLSIIGIAREVAALFRSAVKLPSVDFVEGGDAIEDMASVLVEDEAGCPRYTARVLSGVKLGSSPVWMHRRLLQCGVRPISNVVDITNYVMLECGQPLHAFDHSLLGDHRIVVRRAHRGEKMATLNGLERSLNEETLVIADSCQAVAIAGVMGGAGSEICDSTETVLIESACFQAPDIRRASSRLGLVTESSHRFERGVDISLVDWASRRAAALMVDHAGATAARGVIDRFSVEPREKCIRCRFQRVRDLLGMEISNADVVAILGSLQLTVTESNERECTVRVPLFRGDIEIEADLIEEVARIRGLADVHERTPSARIVPGAGDAAMRSVLGCRAALVGLGLVEVVNYSFVSERLLDEFGVDSSDVRVALPNPVSAEHGALRSSLIPQMVDTLERNLSRQIPDAALFEMGRVYLRDDKDSICEEERVAVGLMGRVGHVGLDRRQPIEAEEMFLRLKGIVEALLSGVHSGDASFEPVARPWLKEGFGVAVLIGDRPCGMIGVVEDGIRRRRRMADPVVVAEMEVNPLVEHVFDTPILKPVPAYPGVSRDIAIIVDESVTYGDVLRIIWKSAPKELTSVELFDTFRSTVIGKARKSLAYSLVYRSLERTLTDEDANRYHGIITEALKKELDVEVRES